MFNTFVVTLREFAELLVIAEALRAFLRHEGRPGMAHVYGGMAAGAAVGLALSLWLLDGSGLPWTRGVAAMLVGGTALLLATGMLSSVKAMQDKVQDWLEVWAERSTVQLAVSGVAAFAAVRETLEVCFFLRANVPGAGWEATLTGAALGAVAAASGVALFRVLTQRVNLLLMFQLSTLVLAMLAIQLLTQGIGDVLKVVTPLALRAPVLEAAAPFMPGGPYYLGLCALLMLLPVLALARSWWHESGARRTRG